VGYGVSHGVYLIHRFREGIRPRQALRSVGRAVACSTLTTLAGWAALLAAGHRGLQSMGSLACLGMAATMLVSFSIMPSLLQIVHDRRERAKEVPPA
jgi:predicted RND superfamily exporter protein